ncbi:MAG: hypothetical protein AWU59_1262 [Methanolobus sp. T82-4]|jgi:hypothetical protein|nr:MAG: hypothetical protein AWU59_1262 [Methanolobus sp. T82-4]
MTLVLLKEELKIDYKSIIEIVELMIQLNKICVFLLRYYFDIIAIILCRFLDGGIMTIGIFGLVEFVAGSVASLLSDNPEMQAHISIFVYILESYKNFYLDFG